MKQTQLAVFGALLAVAGCIETTGTAPTSTSAPTPLSANDPAVQRYSRVVANMEPIAEQACRQRVRSGVNCDFLITLDRDPRKPSNAYQSLDANGRPVLTFTAAILKDFENDHELAFVLGHEAAHHIEGHLAEARQNATIGALVGGGLAVLLGGGETAVDVGLDVGGSVGARVYSKDHELEADALGTRITHAAGYDPVRGAAFFQRIPDPGDRFLGSHPPNGQRIDTVRRTAAQL